MPVSQPKIWQPASADDNDEEEFGSNGRRSITAKQPPRASMKQMDNSDGHLKSTKQKSKLENLDKSMERLDLAEKNRTGKKEAGAGENIESGRQKGAFVEVLKSGLKIHKDLYQELFDHQKEGIAFLYSLYRDGKKGGLLADDMGLGKTIQIIGFLSGMFDAKLIRTTLLVMPTTLIANWIKEFAKWTPGMRVNQFHGASKSERTKNLEKTQRKRGSLSQPFK